MPEKRAPRKRAPERIRRPRDLLHRVERRDRATGPVHEGGADGDRHPAGVRLGGPAHQIGVDREDEMHQRRPPPDPRREPLRPAGEKGVVGPLPGVALRGHADAAPPAQPLLLRQEGERVGTGREEPREAGDLSGALLQLAARDVEVDHALDQLRLEVDHVERGQDEREAVSDGECGHEDTGFAQRVPRPLRPRPEACREQQREQEQEVVVTEQQVMHAVLDERRCDLPRRLPCF